MSGGSRRPLSTGTSASLTPTAVKTGAYTAAVGDLVPVDTTGGAVTITLPAAPADKAQIAVKKIAAVAAAVTVACGGSDVINKTGGAVSVSLTLQNQSVILQYQASTSVWIVVSGDAPLSQLDARYAAAGATGLTTDALAQQRLVSLAAVDREKSRGRQATKWQEDTSYFDQFADLTGWTTQSGVSVSGGKAICAAAGTPGLAGKTLNLTTAQNFRLRAAIDIVAGGAAVGGGAGTMIGINRDTAGTLPTTAKLYSIGVSEDGFAMAYIKGYNSGGSSVISTVAMTGRVYVDIVADDYGISMTVKNADGTIEWQQTDLTRSVWQAGLITNIALFLGDARGPAGHQIAFVEYRVGGGASPVTAARPVVADPAISSVWSQDSAAQQFFVSLPASYRSNEPCPFVLYQHGRSGDERTLIATTGQNANRIRTALNAAGIAVASHNQHGNNWGSDQSLADLLTLYRYVRDHYALGGLGLMAHSMGNISSLLAIAQRKIPGIAGFYGIDAAIDLAQMWTQNSGYRTEINALYGSTGAGDLEAATAAHNPMRLDPSLFRGIPMRFAASTTDTVATKTANTDAFLTKVASWQAEATVGVTSAVPHADPATIDTTDIVPFWQRAFAA